MANHLQHCLQCIQYDHWIEIRLVDEFAKPILGSLTGNLIDNRKNIYKVTFQDGYLCIPDDLPAGPVRLELPTDNLLNTIYPLPSRATTQPSPVPETAKKTKGFKGAQVEYQNITVGDIWANPPEQKLSERHQPRATGEKLILVVDNSYMLEIRAFNFLTVRIGMFFDGTGNNTYDAEYYKKQTHDWAIQCNSPEQETKLSQWCSQHPVSGSRDNEITNIQKLNDLYIEGVSSKSNVITVKQYVEGIGTSSNGQTVSSDDSSIINGADDALGQGTGRGGAGVDAKVQAGSESAITRLKELMPSGYDGIGRFQFDVFGFSRGAAAARHFTNQVIQGDKGYFAKAVKKQNLILSSPFDWTNPNQCQFNFVGIFDTVAAIDNPSDGYNPGIDLAVSSKQTKRLVHLTAADEFRDNFRLNRINSAPQFSEYSLPGAHSDLGGGYYSRYYLDEQHPERMDNALIENIIVAAFASSIIPSQNIETTDVWKRANAWRTGLLNSGWGNSHQITVESTRLRKDYYYEIPTEDLFVKVAMKRVVEGDLSRIYLRAMYGFAKYAGVPLDVFDPASSVHKVSDELNSLAENVLKSAQQNAISSELLSRDAVAHSKYIHYSAEVGTTITGIIHPNIPAQNNHRIAYPCSESNA